MARKFEEGYVYILKNSGGNYKIGQTQQDPMKRLRQINSETGTDGRNEMVAWAWVINCKISEEVLHSVFEHKRLRNGNDRNGRFNEWFSLDDSDIIMLSNRLYEIAEDEHYNIPNNIENLKNKRRVALTNLREIEKKLNTSKVTMTDDINKGNIKATMSGFMGAITALAMVIIFGLSLMAESKFGIAVSVVLLFVYFSFNDTAKDASKTKESIEETQNFLVKKMGELRREIAELEIDIKISK